MQEQELFQRLKAVPFFHRLEEEILQKLSRLVIKEHFQAGELVFREGEPGDALYIVLSGEASVLRLMDREKDEYKSLGLIGHDELFGEMALFDAQPRSATIRAATDLEVVKITASDFQHFLLEDTRSASIVLSEVISVLSRRLREVGREMVAIFETGRIVAASSTAGEIAEKVLDAVMKAIPTADGGFLAFYNRFTDELEIAQHHGLDADDLGDASISMKEPFVSDMVKSRQCYLGHPASVMAADAARFCRVRTLACCPMFSGDHFLGVMAILSHTTDDAFTPAQRNLLAGVGGQMAPALENAAFRREEDFRSRLQQKRW